MPCRYDPTPAEIAEGARRENLSLTNKLNKLTAENDLLREAILSFADNPGVTLPPKVLKVIEADQIKHRKEDLKRLEDLIPMIFNRSERWK